MRLDEIVAWYQKKIGTYDKEQWEKTVEQKILDGFSSVTLKTAKLKPELIDVDLVRGSTFPKAKPKQSLITVIRLAILRYFLLPVHAQWWVKQTSPNIFALLLGLYITQMISWALYTYNINRLEINKLTKSNYEVNNALNSSSETASYRKVSNAQSEEHIISHWDLLIPMALSLLLSLIHSQIVATNTLNSVKNKRRRYSNTNLCNKQQHRDTMRVRRRKKLVKLRSQDAVENATIHLQRKLNPIRMSPPGIELMSTTITIGKTVNAVIALNNQLPNIVSQESITTIPTDNQQQRTMSPANLTLDLNATTDTIDKQVNQLMKKRNVNWHTPLHHYDSNTAIIQTTSQQPATIGSGSDSNSTSNNEPFPFLSSPATSSDNAFVSRIDDSPSKTVRIVDYVQNLNDDLNNFPINTTNSMPNLRQQPAITANDAQHNTRRTIGDDDGFESLNGKSSSGEDNSHLRPRATASESNNLRLRLNATENRHQQHPQPQQHISTDETDEDGEDVDVDVVSSPASAANMSNYNECTTSATEWLGITTNSEECSYSSELDNYDEIKTHQNTDEDVNDMDFTPTTILYPHGTTDRISCTIWDNHEIKKAQMSVLEISSCIIERVESMPETNDYIYIGLFFSFALSLIPCICRLCEVTIDSDKSNEINYLDMPMILWEKASFSFLIIFQFAFGQTQWERSILLMSFLQRLCLTMILFIIFAVAERTFKQRFLYAKLFSHLTSSRRARKSNLPHFRLNKVRNIKTWLSVRSYLKKRGPQRSVDVIVSAAFLVTLLLLGFLSVEWLKDSVHLHSHLNLEALMWSTTIGIFLLRYMTLGNKIQQKYRSVSVLITEQINLYLQIEQKPKKKDELMVSNSVLKLAADLLKELESPFKISGLSANPYLFTTVKVVILSALSGVLSEILGFKLKLHKIKIK